MSKMFDYLVNGGDEKALVEAQLEHMGGYLGFEIEENARLRALNAEMLAALKGALVVLESMPRPTAGLISNEVQKAFDRRHEAVRAAIHKGERS